MLGRTTNTTSTNSLNVLNTIFSGERRRTNARDWTANQRWSSMYSSVSWLSNQMDSNNEAPGGSNESSNTSQQCCDDIWRVLSNMVLSNATSSRDLGSISSDYSSNIATWASNMLGNFDTAAWTSNINCCVFASNTVVWTSNAMSNVAVGGLFKTVFVRGATECNVDVESGEVDVPECTTSFSTDFLSHMDLYAHCTVTEPNGRASQGITYLYLDDVQVDRKLWSVPEAVGVANTGSPAILKSTKMDVESGEHIVKVTVKALSGSATVNAALLVGSEEDNEIMKTQLVVNVYRAG